MNLPTSSFGPEYKAWLAELKAGDSVSYCHNRDDYTITEVVRRTKTGRIVTENLSFSSDGRPLGGMTMLMGYCMPVTQQIKDDIRKKKFVRFLLGTNWENMPIDVLEKIVTVVKQS